MSHAAGCSLCSDQGMSDRSTVFFSHMVSPLNILWEDSSDLSPAVLQFDERHSSSLFLSDLEISRSVGYLCIPAIAFCRIQIRPECTSFPTVRKPLEEKSGLQDVLC